MGKDLESNVIQRKRIVERKNMEGKSVVRGKCFVSATHSRWHEGTNDVTVSRLGDHLFRH